MPNIYQEHCVYRPPSVFKTKVFWQTDAGFLPLLAHVWDTNMEFTETVESFAQAAREWERMNLKRVRHQKATLLKRI